jgi:large subunit ribosomal protein L9
MEVILLQRVEKLGQMGDVVRVKPGFARNYLIPQKIAIRATKEKLEEFKTLRAQLEAQNLKLRKEAEAVADKMSGLSVIIIRQAGESGQLYGSVRPNDIADSITQAGFTVKATQIHLTSPIKALGIYPTKVILHPEVSVDVSVNVALSEEEANAQAENSQAEAPADAS